jgi:hypothetical protein
MTAGTEFVLELVREAARGRRCGSCGRSLAEASIELEDVAPERIAVRASCSCGVVELVEVRPAGEEGLAELR